MSMGRRREDSIKDSTVVIENQPASASSSVPSGKERKEGKGKDRKEKKDISVSVVDGKAAETPSDAKPVTRKKGVTKMVREKKAIASVKTEPSPTVPYAIDVHPQRDEIIQDILDGKSRASIRKKYGLSNDSVIKNFLEKRLMGPIAEKKLEKRDESAAVLQEKLDRIQSYLDKLIDSCDEFLSDPLSPGKYYMGDRADELMVVYEREEELDNGKIIRRRYSEDLQSLLDRGLRNGETALQVKSTRMDIRKLLLDTLSVSQKQIEMIGRITGQMQDILVHADIGGLVIPKLYAIIGDAADSDVEFKHKLLAELESIGEEEGQL